MEKKLKYNPSDYQSLAFYLKDIENKYDDYIKSNKNDIKLILLKESINELRNGLKSAVILQEISKIEAEEMLDYYWELIE